MSHLDIFVRYHRFSPTFKIPISFFFNVMLVSLTNETFWVKFQQLLVYFWPFYIVSQQVERWKEQGYYHKEWWYLFDLCRTTTPFRPFSPEKKSNFPNGHHSMMTYPWCSSFWPFISKLAKVLKKTFKYLAFLPINLTKGTKEGWGPKIDKFFSNFSGMVVTTRWRSFE